MAAVDKHKLLSEDKIRAAFNAFDLVREGDKGRTGTER